MPRIGIPRWPLRAASTAFVIVTLAVACQPPAPAPRPVAPERPARVSFLSVPDGATVRLNGRALVGTTPIEYEAVEPGLHVVEIERQGYQSVRLQRYWNAGAAERVDVALKPLATATPTATPEPTPTPLPPQHARIEFRLPGHSVVVVERDWAPNASDSVLAKLTPNPGRARFESPMAWDALSIDGEPVVARPGGWVPLLAGQHRALAVHGERAASAV